MRGKDIIRARLIRLIRTRAEAQEDVELKFPIEFKIEATPLSLQAKNKNKERWKQQVREAARRAVGCSTWAASSPVFVTIYYFPDGRMQGDVDNIVKNILDGMNTCVYLDDQQVQRVIVQKFESEAAVFAFDNPTPALIDAADTEPPVVYIRIDSDSSLNG
jgi:crossover junction endodeoxyribonuclease RusA